MSFYRISTEEFEEKDCELRNAWVLEVGETTRTEFSYCQFIRNCRELQHFGYRCEGACGRIPRYFRFNNWRRFDQRVYPEWIEIKVEDDRFGDPEYSGK